VLQNEQGLKDLAAPKISHRKKKQVSKYFIIQLSSELISCLGRITSECLFFTELNRTTQEKASRLNEQAEL